MPNKNIKQHNPDILFNIVIIFWLAIPLFLLVYFSIAIVIENQIQFQLIRQQLDIQNITHVIFSTASNESNFPVIIAIIAAFFIYCYIFDLIRKKGYSIYKFENQNLKFISSLDHLFILSSFGLIILIFLETSFIFQKKDELMFIAIIFTIFLITLLLFLELRDYFNTYSGLNQLNEIVTHNYRVQEILSNKNAFINFFLGQYNALSSFIFIVTFLFLFISFKMNFNILSIIFIETVLLQIHLIYSSISLSPKKIHNIRLKNTELQNVFILSDSPNGYYSILLPNDEIKFIMKDEFVEISPIQKIKQPLEFKVNTSLDESITNRDFLCIAIGSGIFWALGGVLILVFSIFLPQTWNFVIIIAIILTCSFILRFKYSIVHAELKRNPANQNNNCKIFASCKKCGSQVDPYISGPCPQCGCINKNVRVEITEYVKIIDNFQVGLKKIKEKPSFFIVLIVIFLISVIFSLLYQNFLGTLIGIIIDFFALVLSGMEEKGLLKDLFK